ncbi:hypothetical protein HpBT056_11850 [Helicobacter pylori]
MESRIKQTALTPLRPINGILTNIDCKVLKNNFYSVCYSSELKNPIYGVSVLFGDLVDKNNIEKRLKWTHD